MRSDLCKIRDATDRYQRRKSAGRKPKHADARMVNLFMGRPIVEDVIEHNVDVARTIDQPAGRPNIAIVPSIVARVRDCNHDKSGGSECKRGIGMT